MCLVSVCPKGTEKNSEKVRRFIMSGFDSNKQGSGFMYKRNGSNKIVIDKGYFEVESMIKAIEKAKLGLDDELVIHHRISTAGKVTPENSHPFIITDDPDECRETDITVSKPCLAHNGMFKELDKYEKLNPEMSDTFAFACYIMSDRRIMDLFLNDREKFDIVMDGVIGYSKVAILFPDRDVEMIGKFIEDEGYFHSNGGYCKLVYNRGGVESEKGGSGAGFGNRFRSRHAPIFSTNESEERDFDSLDVTTPIYLLPAPTNNGKKLSKLVLLDSTIINLSIDNYKHFWFVRKNIYDNASDKEALKLLEVSNFDINSHLQAVSCKGDGATTFKTILTSDLINDCYYIPKGEYYNTIYSDYKYLYSKAIVPTLNGLKNLRKVINKNYQKRALEQLNYKKLNKKFCKQALVMHLSDLEAIWDTKENGNKMKPVLEAMN